MATTSAVLDKSLVDLGLGENWELRNGTWWATLPAQLVRPAASQLLAIHARFITITAIELTSHELRMDYHWDLGGQIVTLAVIADGKLIDSIADISPGSGLGRTRDTRILRRRVSRPRGYHAPHVEDGRRTRHQPA